MLKENIKKTTKTRPFLKIDKVQKSYGLFTVRYETTRDRNREIFLENLPKKLWRGCSTVTEFFIKCVEQNCKALHV